MKIAVIGGGSTYTPELVSGLSRERGRIDVSDLVLHDIDPERREVVGGLAQFRTIYQVQWNLTMAATLLFMAPVIIVFFLAQRAFVEGVTLTGVKG